MMILVAGGFTFACNPADDCTRVVPIWTATLDPCVLAARARDTPGLNGPTLDIARHSARIVADDSGEHIGIQFEGGILRLDVIAGTVLAGAVSIQLAVRLGAALEHQLRAVRRLDAMIAGRPCRAGPDRTLRRLILALRTLDACRDGASLREIGLALVGSDWPGDGEHVKSKTRRLVDLARQLEIAGPAGVLHFTI
jgi:hypothetical protein